MTHLTVRQTSAFNGFHFTVTNGAGAQVADIEWPFMQQASNARLAWNRSEIDGRPRINLHGQALSVAFEYLDRGWVNDVRFRLTSSDARVFATAEMIFPPGRPGRGVLTLVQPVEAVLVRKSRFPRQRIELVGQGGVLASIVEPRFLSFTREFSAHLQDDLGLAVQTFVLFLALHVIQTQA